MRASQGGIGRALPNSPADDDRRFLGVISTANAPARNGFSAAVACTAEINARTIQMVARGVTIGMLDALR
jgi:hypothetical protein